MRYWQILVMICVLGILAVSTAGSTSLTPLTRGQGVPGPGCEDGMILDDGSFETAYGWVPSAQWGEYVQTFHIGSAHPFALESVCVCWTRTREDDSLVFELEVYEDVEGLPSDEPLIVVDATMTAVPAWSEGRFTEVVVGLDAPLLAPGIYHVGVRWAPSINQYFFVCADQSFPDDPVPGFFRDDRSDGEWASVLESSDPIFGDHTAMLIRVRGREVPATPAVGLGGAFSICGLIALSAWWFLRRKG